MVLSFYYLDASPPARSVDLVIHAISLPVEYKNVNFLEKEQFSPEFLKLNPLHTIPCIVDGDFVLWESRAILTYLVSKYGKDDSLYPKDLQKRAIVDQRLHYSNDVFYVLKMIARGLIFSNEKTIPETLLAKTRETQENVEKLLENNKFMAGESLTVADYSYITLMDVLEVMQPTGNKFPATKAWTERCKSTMKDFEKVNKIGAEKFAAILKKSMSS